MDRGEGMGMNLGSENETDGRAAMSAHLRSSKPKTSPAPLPRRLNGRDFSAMALWLTLPMVAELIGVPAKELAPFVNGWLRDPVEGEKARTVKGVERYARENALKLKVYVQPKPQKFFTLTEARKALGMTTKAMRRWMWEQQATGLTDWSYREHGRIEFYFPLNDSRIPPGTRKMESPCPSLCKPAGSNIFAEIWQKHAASGRPWGPSPERKTRRRVKREESPSVARIVNHQFVRDVCASLRGGKAVRS